jgi:hypothetical protein
MRHGGSLPLVEPGGSADVLSSEITKTGLVMAPAAAAILRVSRIREERPMKRLMISAAVLALMAGPALAQMSSSTTETSKTVTESAPVMSAPLVPAPEQPSTTYEKHTVTHSENGDERVDRSSDKYVAPDGSTTTTKKVIEQDVH